MNYLAVHRSAATSLATGRLWLGADEVTQAASAAELLHRLQALLDTRQAELDTARAQAVAEGRAAGRQEALDAIAPRLADAWDQAARSAVADLATLRQGLVNLSLQVVQHIADQMGAADVVPALAARAAQTLLPDSAAIVRVHPDVAAAVRARLAGAAGVLEVRGDERLGALDCAFDTPAGQVLASLPVQMARLAEALAEPPAEPR